MADVYKTVQVSDTTMLTEELKLITIRIYQKVIRKNFKIKVLKS
jgi:hypothetical protein